MNKLVFVDILKTCATYDRTNPVDLSSADMVIPGGTKPISQLEPDRLVNTVMPAVAETISKIHYFAPNAAILLMGYPQPVEASASCNQLFRTKSILWFQDITNQLHDLMATKVTAFHPNEYGSSLYAGVFTAVVKTGRIRK
ncbi:hypothetical protein [Amycolatopsis sp. lyj-23]|uniref:hypothetical protein n=1 Tax=Amycolatopsis sp. lyj-23 TaxID=2789283 RepID=UPI00397E1707